MEAESTLIQLSQAVALAPELTQGAGGNTSVKDGDTMLIKASGFRLDEVRNDKGFVRVKHGPVSDFLKHRTDALQQPDTVLKQFVNEQIVGDKTFLPSMETGFHAVLKNCVIHTHPVLVNQLLCCTGGEALLRSIFKNETITVIPSVNPGYFLSKAIADIDTVAPLIFLQNHGLIVHADTAEGAIALHEKVIAQLTASISSGNDFNFSLSSRDEHHHTLQARWLTLFFSQTGLLSSTFFPDQAVVIGNNYRFSAAADTSVKLHFNTADHTCTLHAGHKNAMAIAENLCALANIATYSEKHQLSLNALPDADVAYILGMDMEKYRQSLLK